VHYLIVLGSYQGVYPNAHCSGVDKSKGSQWALSDPTLSKDVFRMGFVWACNFDVCRLKPYVTTVRGLSEGMK
jgi:hypothetical protein